jgi:hypothetical protein
MRSSQLPVLLRYLSRAAGPGNVPLPSDRELLDRFVGPGVRILLMVRRENR